MISKQQLLEIIGQSEPGRHEYLNSLFRYVPDAIGQTALPETENALFLRIKNIMSTLVFEKKNDREYIFMNCKERLVKYLVNSYENKKPVNALKYKLDKTQLELLDRTGFNIRSIQRNIAALEKENLISIENGKITIS